jgi:Zn finger protein HypA/HybF involved in hydrogenase expression
MMERIDPINLTEGRACALCGGDSTGTSIVNGALMATCDACFNDQIFDCADCEQDFTMDHAHRSYGTSALYCDDCDGKQLAVVHGREIEARIDERKHDR